MGDPPLRQLTHKEHPSDTVAWANSHDHPLSQRVRHALLEQGVGLETVRIVNARGAVECRLQLIELGVGVRVVLGETGARQHTTGTCSGIAGGSLVSPCTMVGWTAEVFLAIVGLYQLMTASVRSWFGPQRTRSAPVFRANARLFLLGAQELVLAGCPTWRMSSGWSWSGSSRTARNPARLNDVTGHEPSPRTCAARLMFMSAVPTSIHVV